MTGVRSIGVAITVRCVLGRQMADAEVFMASALSFTTLTTKGWGDIGVRGTQTRGVP